MGVMMGRRELRLVYTVSEAAELLGIGRSTAYELVARGELPTVRIGRRLVVTRPALIELVGVEPPPPYELDTMPDDRPDQPAPRARSSSRPAQPHLPFGA